MIRFLTLAALFFAAPAAAQDRVSILLGSRHIGASGYHETNPGVFLTWEDRGGLDLSMGLYSNSYGRRSMAAVAALPVARWDGGALSLFVGLAHYPQDGRRSRVAVGDVVPLAGVQVRHGPFFAQAIPMDGRPVKALIAFGLTFPVDR